MLEAVSVQDSSATGSWKSWLNPQRDCNTPKIPFYKPGIGAGEIDEGIAARLEEDPAAASGNPRKAEKFAGKSHLRFRLAGAGLRVVEALMVDG